MYYTKLAFRYIIILFRKLFLMKHMAQQHDEPGIHEDLNKNFVELWSSTELILEELEKHFPYSFHAKVYLTEIFVVKYIQVCIVFCIEYLTCHRMLMKRVKNICIKFLFKI